MQLCKFAAKSFPYTPSNKVEVSFCRTGDIHGSGENISPIYPHYTSTVFKEMCMAHTGSMVGVVEENLVKLLLNNNFIIEFPLDFFFCMLCMYL